MVLEKDEEYEVDYVSPEEDVSDVMCLNWLCPSCMVSDAALCNLGSRPAKCLDVSELLICSYRYILNTLHQLPSCRAIYEFLESMSP